MNEGGHQNINIGNMCIFKRIDDSTKCLIGRVTQFSYLTGNKRARQYSSNYVDMFKKSKANIGVLANWFQGTKSGNENCRESINFKPLNLFTAGYLSMKNCIATINESTFLSNAEFSFSVPTKAFELLLPKWTIEMTFRLDFVLLKDSRT